VLVEVAGAAASQLSATTAVLGSMIVVQLRVYTVAAV
jgi:hypothetical protein